MPRSFRPGVVFLGAAFMAGWLYRKVFPKIVCPKCGSESWRRIGGGLKECRECSWKFLYALASRAGERQ
jgi:transposase-like protein